MAVTKPTEPSSEDTTIAPAEAILPTTGFNVFVSGSFIGNYETEADAQAYVTGHLAPQSIEAEIKPAG